MLNRRTVRSVVVYLAVFACVGTIRAAWGQNTPPVVYVISIEGMIDLGLAPFLSRILHEAKETGAAAVVVEINTFGGRVDAAVAMRDALLGTPVRTIAFVNQRAISAGALIALACTTVVMTQGGTIGAATPVLSGSGQTQPTDEKSVSYVRKEFRATAEARNRPPEFAEAMVDVDVEIQGVINKGKLLTLTTTEALEHKVADFRADTIEVVLEATGLAGADIRRTSQTWAETLVRFLTTPLVASILMTLGLLGLVVELRTPGFAVPGAIGPTLLGLFFWGHWIVRLAGWEELLLVLAGVILLALELLVFPGVTIAGVAGAIALIAGLGLSLVGAGATVPVIINGLGRVAMSLLVAMAGAFAILRMLPHLPFGRRLVLDSAMSADSGYISAPNSDHGWLGRTGTTMSPLRPAGIADIDSNRIDVVSDGGFIESATPIQVIRVDGNRIVVRPLTSTQENRHDGS